MAVSKKKEKENKVNVKQFDALHQVAFWGLGLLLFLPPYFRGLYFAPDQQRFLILATLVFWLAFVWQRRQGVREFLRGPLDYFALALPAVYLMSWFGAVNQGLAADAVLKNILYFMVFWSASRLIRNQDDLSKLLRVIYISAVGVALAGLCSATEILYIDDGFLKERIYSTFQYPNALASYLGAVLLVGLYQWDRLKSASPSRQWPSAELQGYLYALGNFLLLAVLLGTKSRGGLLIFVVVLLIYLAGLGVRERLPVTLQMLVNGCAAYLAMTNFIQLALSKQYTQAWLWLGIGLVLALAGQWIYRRVEKHVLMGWYDIPGKYNRAWWSVVAMAVLGAGVYLTTKGDLLAKLMSFDYLRNVFERLYFVRDAVQMFLQKPLLGWGGGGWKEAYRYFQDYLYNSNEAHSYYFQVGVETGLLGLLAVAGIWLAFLYYIYQLYRNRQTEPQEFQVVWVLCAAFLLIGGHALIDFDLSLSALTILLWTFFGIVANYRARLAMHKQTVKANARPKLPEWAVYGLVTLAALAVFSLSVMLLRANAHLQAAGQYIRANQPAYAQYHLERAVPLNPYNAGVHTTLSQIYRAGVKPEQALAEAERAVELSPYNPANRINLAETYLALGKDALAVEQADKAMSLSRYQLKWYEELSRISFTAGRNKLEGNKQEAGGYLQKTAGLPEQMSAIREGLPEQYDRMWRDGPRLEPTEYIYLQAGAAKYLLGDNQAGAYLAKAINSKQDEVKGEALIWLALVAEQEGRSAEARELTKQAGAYVDNPREVYEQYRKLGVIR